MRCHSCPAAQKDYTTMSQTKDICKQYNKETDTIEILHDSDIAQGTQQTTMANTGCVQGWDANGNAIFIPRDSVLQILAEVINANSQSTITTLFGMNGSGAGATPAAINMANLASVLGVEPKDTNTADETRTGVWRYGDDLILVWNYTTSNSVVVIQLYFNINPGTPGINHVYTRVFSTTPYTWSSYKEL